MAECDIDDLLCQLRVLQNMRDLKAALGDDKFIQRFPELEGLDEKLVTEIQTSESGIRDTVAECGNISVDEIPGIEEFREEVLEGEE